MTQVLSSSNLCSNKPQEMDSNGIIKVIDEVLSRTNEQVLKSAIIGQSLYILSEKQLQKIRQDLISNNFHQKIYLRPINESIIQGPSQITQIYNDHTLAENITLFSQDPESRIRLLSRQQYKALTKEMNSKIIQIERRVIKEKGKISLEMHPTLLEIQIVSRIQFSLNKDIAHQVNQLPRVSPIRLKLNFYFNQTIQDILNKIKVKLKRKINARIYAYDESLFQLFPFQRMVEYYASKQNRLVCANTDQQAFYQLEQDQANPYLQFFPGKLLTNQSHSQIESLNTRRLVLQLKDEEWIFPKQPQFSKAGNCKFCMMRLQLYVRYDCQECCKQYFFCSRICHYQYLLQHSCKEAARRQILASYGQDYMGENINNSKVNTFPKTQNQLQQSNSSIAQFDVNSVFSKKKASQVKSFGGGMANMGNTCYLNASLQNLIRTKLSDELMKVESTIKNSRNCKLAKAYLTLIDKLKRTTSSEYLKWHEMQAFKEVVNKEIQLFNDYQQHDAHQFIMFFLDRLSEELNVNRNINQPLNAIQSKNRVETIANREWFKFIAKNNSPIVHLFYGQTLTQIDCPHCHSVNRTFDSFNILSISIPNRHYSVELYFQSYQFKERIKLLKIQMLACSIAQLIKYVCECLALPSYKSKIIKCFLVGFQNPLAQVKHNELLPKVLQRVQKAGSTQNQLFLFEMPSQQCTHLSFKFMINNQPVTLKKPLFFQHNNAIRNFKIYQVVTEYFISLAALYMNKDEDEKKKIDEMKKRIQTNAQKYFTISIHIKEEKGAKSIPISPDTSIAKELSANSQLWVHINNFSQISPKEKDFFTIIRDKLKMYKRVTQLKKPIKYDINEMPQTIQQCLKEQFNRKQLLDNQNKWHCATCDQKRRVHRTTHLYKTNKYLFVHLKRFVKSNSGEYIKNQNKVKVSLRLDLTEILNNPTLPQGYYQHLSQQTLSNYHLPSEINTKESYNYKLIGLILHKGNIGSGHYTALFDNEGWRSYNDQVTKSVSIQSLLDLNITMEKIYILLYERLG